MLTRKLLKTTGRFMYYAHESRLHTCGTHLTERQTVESSGFDPSWAPGSGHYGNTWGRVMTARPVSTLHELTMQYLDTVPVKSSTEVFTIADYGTGDGFVSMALITKMIGHLKGRRGHQLPIQVLYEDQEKNDFNSLFNRLYDGTGYMSQFDNVYPMATNTNFWKQCVPDGSCDVILCTNAVHWVSNPSYGFQDATIHISPRVTEGEFRHFRKEGAALWETFLLLRARELKPGGLLVMMSPSVPDNYRELVTQRGDAEANRSETRLPVFRAHCDLEGAWRDLKDAKEITEEEYRRYIMHMAYRSLQDINRPFQQVGSRVRQAGLTLNHLDEQFFPNLFGSAIQWPHLAGDAERRQYFADQMVVLFKTMVSAHLQGQLWDMRSDEEKRAIVERFFDAFRRRVASYEPDKYFLNAAFFRLVVTKNVN